MSEENKEAKLINSHFLFTFDSLLHFTGFASPIMVGSSRDDNIDKEEKRVFLADRLKVTRIIYSILRGAKYKIWMIGKRCDPNKGKQLH